MATLATEPSYTPEIGDVVPVKAAELVTYTFAALDSRAWDRDQQKGDQKSDDRGDQKQGDQGRDAEDTQQQSQDSGPSAGERVGQMFEAVGSLVRWLVTTGATDVDALVDFEHPQGYRYEPRATVREGHQAALTFRSAV